MSRPVRSIRRAVVVPIATVALLASACGGSDDSGSDPSPAVTDAGGGDTTPVATDAPTTDAPVATEAPTTEPGGDASFDGPSFVDVIDDALAPYAALVGQPFTAEAVVGALPGVSAGAPVMPGLTIVSAARTMEEWDVASIDDTQLVGAEGVVGGLEAFGASVSAPWTQSSFATSGSLSTLLLTDGGTGRVSYVEESDPAGSFRAPVEMAADLTASEIVAPAWVASLPALEGGRVVEYTEAHGLSSENLLAGTDFVLVRFRYAADQIDALNAFLESGVIEAAGFTYDKDMFNGFENMVDVTIGDWSGTVLVGSGSMGDEEFYDLVWSLTR